MFAVIRTGGKQYRVVKGDVLDVERLAGDAGAAITFGEVLMTGAKIGAPTVSGASVMGEIVEQARRPRSSPSRRSGARTRIASAAIASM